MPLQSLLSQYRMIVCFIMASLYLRTILAVKSSSSQQSSDNPFSNLPECSPENLKLAQASEGSWYLLPDGTFTYAFSHCRLRRFTRTTAAKCLKGTHIVFMGDSLSRYFYLSLAYLFAHNEWAIKFAKIPAHPTLPKSILSERDFQNWALFYHKSNKLLNKGKRILEICDCFRNDSRPFIALRAGDPHQQSDCIENRHLRYIPSEMTGNQYLNDQENDVRLSYIQWYGLMPMRGHRAITLSPRNDSIIPFLDNLNKNLCPENGESFHPLSKGCSEQRKSRKQLHAFDFPDFCHQLEDCDQIYEREKETKCQRFEKNILGPLGTTHVILNVGWHAGLQHCDKKFLEKMVDSAERYFAKPGPSYPSPSNAAGAGAAAVAASTYESNLRLAKVTWRSATHGAVFEGDGEKIAKEFYVKELGKNRFDYFDVFGMTKVLRDYHYKVENHDHQGLKRSIKLSALWPKEKQVNASTVLTTWVDPAHLEPWAYAEIHDVFLNSVCPIDLK